MGRSDEFNLGIEERSKFVLKDCPFCKSKQLNFVSCCADWYRYYFIRCEICHAQGPCHDEKEKAVELWNTR